VGVLAAGGGLLASRSVSALMARNTQLEQQAHESEARVAELQVLRASMERRLKLLEQHQTGLTARREGEARRKQEADARLARRESAWQELEVRLKEELARGDAWLDASAPESPRVELSERLLFEPGQSTLTPQGQEVLARVGAVLAAVEGHEVRVSSHTDELPATTSAGTEGTSWELSSARATAITRWLLGAPARMAPERLSATGHASFRPAVPADSPQNRLRNRRVELALSPMPLPPAALLAATEPAPPSPGAPKKKPASSGGKSRKKRSPR
jgi:chemotaxis protein MotB